MRESRLTFTASDSSWAQVLAGRPVPPMGDVVRGRRRGRCSRRLPRDGTLAGVAAWLTSLIAVTGTLLGSTITYLFQRSQAGRAEAVARSERLRQERIAAYSGFAGAITELRRGVITLWFHRLRQSDSADPELLAAFTEADRLGAAADHAQFRVQLLAGEGELIALAEATFDPIDSIRSAANRAELVKHEELCQDKLKTFIAAAGSQVR